MTYEQETRDISELFSNASIGSGVSKKYEGRNGVLNLKRKVLGFCGEHSVKSLEELDKVLQDLNITNSTDESKRFIEEELIGEGKRAYYTGSRYLVFEKIAKDSNHPVYDITMNMDTFGFA